VLLGVDEFPEARYNSKTYLFLTVLLLQMDDMQYVGKLSMLCGRETT
jgi:hypothetical protein